MTRGRPRGNGERTRPAVPLPWPPGLPPRPGRGAGQQGDQGPYADVDTIDETDAPQAAPGAAPQDPGGDWPDPAFAPPRPGGALLAWLWGEQGLAGEYLLARRSMTIGRDPGSDIVLTDQTVCPEHARIAYRNGQWWLRPVDTAGRTWVNGRPAAPGQHVPITNGDRLRFGFHTQLRLLVPGAR